VRVKFDKKKSEDLRRNPNRGIGFEEAQKYSAIRSIWTSARTIRNNIVRLDG